MLQYLHLRWQIYQHELRQMLASISQLFVFIWLLFYLALPIFILTPLVSLSVIADLDTSLGQRTLYQWSYFFLLYFLLRMQKKAILAVGQQHYLKSLPVSATVQSSVSLVLTLVAGNLPLIAPLALLFYISDLAALIQQAHFVLFSIAVALLAWSAVNKNRFPWLSLVALPSCLVLPLPEGASAVTTINLIVVLVFAMEIFFSPVSWLSNTRIKVTSYWKVRVLAMLDKPASVLSRVIIISLLLAFTVYFQYKLNQVAIEPLQVFIGWISVLLIGSYQFDNEKFYRDYPHYLASLFYSYRYRYFNDILPVLCAGLLVSLFMLWLDFAWYSLLLIPFGAVFVSLCVTRFNRNFFILPSLVFGGLIVCLLVI